MSVPLLLSVSGLFDAKQLAAIVVGPGDDASTGFSNDLNRLPYCSSASSARISDLGSGPLPLSLQKLPPHHLDLNNRMKTGSQRESWPNMAN